MNVALGKTFVSVLLKFALVIVIVHVNLAFAQNSSETNDEKYREQALKNFKARDVRADFLVPTSPAFNALGVTPKEVIRPDTPKALAAALLNGVDTEGNLQTGIAIDTAPIYLLLGQYMTLEDYRKKTLQRYLHRFQFSIGTTKGSDKNDESLRMALGFRIALLDRGDPRLSGFLDNCYAQNHVEHGNITLGIRKEYIERKVEVFQKEQAIQEAETQNADQEEIERLKRELQDLMEKRDLLYKQLLAAKEKAETVLRNEVWTKCNEEFRKLGWNATNFTVGVAPVFFSKNGDFGDLNGSGMALYGTFAYGFEEFTSVDWLRNNSQLIFHARYRTNEQVADPSITGNFIEQDVWIVGSQIRVAGPDFGEKIGGPDLAFYGEFDYRHANPEGRKNDGSYRYALGMEFKISKDLTLDLTVGDESGDKIGRSHSFALGDLKFTF